MDKFRAIYKDETIQQMTKILRREFSNIFMIVKDALLKRFSKVRGRTYCTAPAGVLFFLLKTQKPVHRGSYESMKSKISLSNFQSLLWFVMETVADDLHDCAVIAVEGKITDEVSKKEELSIFISSVSAMWHRYMFTAINKIIWFP